MDSLLLMSSLLKKHEGENIDFQAVKKENVEEEKFTLHVPKSQLMMLGNVGIKLV